MPQKALDGVVDISVEAAALPICASLDAVKGFLFLTISPSAAQLNFTKDIMKL
jgi:hypothetical protein